ncbi:siderophore-interacting protein [Nonomuraea fuscirosea]|uniref:siderophore-interacting protein n=1 Tax=Nonomuraea fuscirosea TaxID=1291556 RepID=UPI003410D8A5
MARGNLNSTRIKPRTSELLVLRVLRRERLPPHFARVTLGGAEIPSPQDRQPLDHPEGVEVSWIVRDDPGAVPGTAALSLPVPQEPCYGWVVGESELPVRLRRHWVRAGVPKEHIMFCGYWRHH